MKKQILSILFTLSFLISFSQLVSYEAIWVNDGMEDDYIAVEEMWSEVKKQAIADNLQDFWIVFKVEKDSTNPDHLTKPDYIVMNGFEDDAQRTMQKNWKELGMKVYKGKMSKRKFEKAWDKTPTVRKETRNFLVERLDNSVWSPLAEGKEARFLFNGFKALNDDYESFEMKYFKENHNKQIEAGSRAWWDFNKVISRSENANQEVTHFTMDVIDANYQWSNDNEPSFTDQMMSKYGVASRERVIGDRMSMVYALFQENE
ncbi:MAG: hypothetical protein ACJ0PE_06375 [Flavobacteriaceae bacterium]|jgi:hypothetical protein